VVTQTVLPASRYDEITEAMV
jgi:hypothetical protein